MAGDPFAYLTAINQTKEDLTSDEYGEKSYNPYLINRGLSFFRDTIMQANEMNRYHFLDKRMQFIFLLQSVSTRKRFSKWFKADKIADLEAVKEFYGYSNQRAKEALALLSPEQLAIIKTKINRGGAP